jgi:hypothetical protein
MRSPDWRAAGIGLIGLLAAATAWGQPPAANRPAGGLPPSVTEPKPSTADNAGPRATAESASAERLRLMIQLQELIRRLNERPAGSGIDRPLPIGKPPVGPSPRPKFEFPETGKPIDGLRVAMNLFRDNDFNSALRAFRLIDTTSMSREDRAFVQYMTASCLRRLNRNSEAAVIYREVADARDDEFITECAVAQLSMIRSAQELETQLEQLRSRQKGR